MKTVRLKFYTKPQCPLCEKVEVLLEAAERRWPMKIERINIQTDPVLYGLYGKRIPVLEFRDGRCLEAPIGREELMKALRSRAKT